MEEEEVIDVEEEDFFAIIEEDSDDENIGVENQDDLFAKGMSIFNLKLEMCKIYPEYIEKTARELDDFSLKYAGF